MGERINQYTERVVEGWLESDYKVKPGEFLTFVEDGKAVAVDFLCPCGCGSECYTPVVQEGSPPPNNHTWTYSRGPNGPTLRPSILYTSGCKSHFHITDGRPQW